MDRRQWILFWCAAVSLIFVKEDLIPLLTFFGLYLVVRGDRWQGACLVCLSLAAFLTIVRLVIPSMNEAGQFGYAGAYDSILRRPWTIPFTLFSPATKFETFMLWLLPFALLPLASPLSLLLIPFMLSRFLSDSPTHWGTTFHYTAPLAPILAMSAGDGLRRLAAHVRSVEARRRVLTGFSVASVVLSLFLPGNQPFWKLFRPSYYLSTPALEAGYRSLRLVPDEASVVAQGVVVPHLAHREHIYMLDATDRDADYVIAVMHLSPWPSANADELRAQLDRYRTRGYASVFDEQGWIVLRRFAR